MNAQRSKLPMPHPANLFYFHFLTIHLGQYLQGIRIVARVKLILVASSNGLGHARRLLNLGVGLRVLKVDFRLAITRTQERLLKSEIESLFREPPPDLLRIEAHGLESVLFRDSYTPDEVHGATRQALVEADAVISDNSLWPALYNPNFFLFGHFEWLTYVRNLPMDNQEKIRETDVFKIEQELITKTLTWFRTRHFSINNELLDPISLDVPLLRYGGDQKYPTTRTNLLWVSRGTTGRNTPLTEGKHFSGYPSVRRESWEMATSDHLPRAVIGRPGLGTIRDCLASNTPFIPSWRGIDSELASNESRLQELGLALDLETGGGAQTQGYRLDAVSDAMGKFWALNSDTSIEVASQILEKIQRK